MGCSRVSIKACSQRADREDRGLRLVNDGREVWSLPLQPAHYFRQLT